MSIKYNVKTEAFTEKHYIKKFRKKYKTHWDSTLKGILKMLEGLDSILDTDIIEQINFYNDLVIFKMEFRVFGTKCSKKSSGNRCILALNNEIKEIRILLVYHKNDIGEKNETATWKKIIRDNYSNYKFCK